MQSYRKITLNKIILSFNKATRNIAVHGFRLNASYGSSRAEVFCKKGVPRNFTKFAGKHMCQNLFFNKAETCNFIKNETLVQVFSCEFCETFKNTFFAEHLRATASVPSTFPFSTFTFMYIILVLFTQNSCRNKY